MRHVSSWLQAALLPERWDVCGIICPSVSVWHSFMLSQCENKYLCGGETSRDDAAELLMYCSGGHAHGRRLFLSTAHRRATMRNIARRLRRLSQADIDRAVLDYLGTCLRRPEHKRPEPDPKAGVVPRAAAAPMGWVLADFLSRSMPLNEAWDTPYAVACCLFDAHRDIKGEVTTLESIEEEIRFDEWEAKRGKRTS